MCLPDLQNDNVCVCVCVCVCVLLQRVKPRSRRQNTEEATGLLTCKSCECAEGGSVGSENIVMCVCIAITCVCIYVHAHGVDVYWSVRSVTCTYVV